MEIERLNPALDITAIVCGSDVLNDATRTIRFTILIGQL